jgi:hypothetical protein
MTTASAAIATTVNKTKGEAAGRRNLRVRLMLEQGLEAA